MFRQLHRFQLQTTRLLLSRAPLHGTRPSVTLVHHLPRPAACVSRCALHPTARPSQIYVTGDGLNVAYTNTNASRLLMSSLPLGVSRCQLPHSASQPGAVVCPRAARIDCCQWCCVS